MKRIFIFSSSKSWGGTEKNAFLRVSELVKRGYDARLVLSSDYLIHKAKEEKIPYLVLKSGGDANPVILISYIIFLKKWKPNIVLATMNKDYWLLCFTAKLTRIKRILNYLGIERKFTNKLKYKWIFKNFSNGIIVNSEVIKDSLIKNHNYFSEKNTFVIYNGFSIKNTKVEKNTILEKYKTDKETILIGFAGRLTKQKGFDLLTEIFKEIKSNKKFKFLVAGLGELKAEIIQKINENELNDRIELLGFQSNMSEFYEAIDLFILCSRNEGMANVLNEAMSYGNPVISTRVSGSERLLKNGELGPIIEIEDVKGIADQITFYLENDLCKKDDRFKQHILENYSIKKMIDETEDVFFNK